MSLEELIQFLEVLFIWSLQITIGLGCTLVLLKVILTVFKKQIFMIAEILFSY